MATTTAKPAVAVTRMSQQEAPSVSSISQLAARLGTTPSGLKELTEKMVRAALLSRPLDGVNFFASFLDAEINRQSIHKLQQEAANPKRVSRTADQLKQTMNDADRSNITRAIRRTSGMPEHFAILRPQVKWQPKPRKPLTNSERSLQSVLRSRASMKPASAAEHSSTSRKVPDRQEGHQIPTSLDSDKVLKMYVQKAKFDAGLAMIIDRELALYRRLGEKVSRHKEIESTVALQEDVEEPIHAIDAAIQSDYRLDLRDVLYSTRGDLTDFPYDVREKQTATWIADDYAGQLKPTDTTKEAAPELNLVGRTVDVDVKRKRVEETSSASGVVDQEPKDFPEDEPSVIEARMSNLRMIREMLHPDEEAIRRKLIATEEDMESSWVAEHPDAPIFADDISPMELERYYRYQTGRLMGKERIASIDEEAVRRNLITDEDELASNWQQFQLKKTRSYERDQTTSDVTRFDRNVQLQERLEEMFEDGKCSSRERLEEMFEDDDIGRTRRERTAKRLPNGGSAESVPSSHALADFDDKSTLVLNLDTLRQLKTLESEKPSVHAHDDSYEEPLPHALLSSYIPAFETDEMSVHALEDAYESLLAGNNFTWVETWSQSERKQDPLSKAHSHAAGVPHLDSMPSDEPSISVMSDATERMFEDRSYADDLPSHVHLDHPMTADDSLQNILATSDLPSHEHLNHPMIADDSLQNILETSDVPSHDFFSQPLSADDEVQNNLEAEDPYELNVVKPYHPKRSAG